MYKAQLDSNNICIGVTGNVDVDGIEVSTMDVLGMKYENNEWVAVENAQGTIEGATPKEPTIEDKVNQLCEDNTTILMALTDIYEKLSTSSNATE